LIIRATPYTMEARTQDKWWKPVTDTGLTEMRWVRAVETRTANIEGRKILHPRRRVADSGRKTGAAGIQADRGRRRRRTTMRRRLAIAAPGFFSEWAIGKEGDVYREGSGKLLLPGRKSAGTFTSRRRWAAKKK
jgi:hypothetical protein